MKPSRGNTLSWDRLQMCLQGYSFTDAGVSACFGYDAVRLAVKAKSEM